MYHMSHYYLRFLRYFWLSKDIKMVLALVLPDNFLSLQDIELKLVKDKKRETFSVHTKTNTFTILLWKNLLTNSLNRVQLELVCLAFVMTRQYNYLDRDDIGILNLKCCFYVSYQVCPLALLLSSVVTLYMQIVWTYNINFC